jgi:hypothetical protein
MSSDEVYAAGRTRQVTCWPPFSGLVPIRHPFGKELNPGLGPGAFSSRRRGRHDGPADPANPVVDGGGVQLHVVIICEIVRLAHRVNVSFTEKRQNVRSKARLIGHESKYLKDAVAGAVRQPNAGSGRDNAAHLIIFLGIGLEHRIHPKIVARGIDWLSPVQFFDNARRMLRRDPGRFGLSAADITISVQSQEIELSC